MEHIISAEEDEGGMTWLRMPPLQYMYSIGICCKYPKDKSTPGYGYQLPTEAIPKLAERSEKNLRPS